MKLYTVWAVLKEDPSAYWMIWCCDEYSYEGDPDARDAELAAAKARQDDSTDYREVTFVVNTAALDKVFLPDEIDVEVA